MIIFPSEYVPQGGEDWMRLRLGRPTASEAGLILTPTKGEKSKSQAGYACRHVDERVTGGPKDVKPYYSGAMQAGHLWEPEICRSFETDHGVRLERVGLVVSDCGRFACSPDRLVFGEESLVPTAGFEAKFYHAEQHLEWLEGPAVLPAEFKCQVHACMVVTGLKVWHLRNYCPPYDPFDVRVEWDAFTDKMQAALDDFDRTEFRPRLAKVCENAVLRRQVEQFDAEYAAMLDRVRRTP